MAFACYFPSSTMNDDWNTSFHESFRHLIAFTIPQEDVDDRYIGCIVFQPLQRSCASGQARRLAHFSVGERFFDVHRDQGFVFQKQDCGGLHRDPHVSRAVRCVYTINRKLSGSVGKRTFGWLKEVSPDNQASVGFSPNCVNQLKHSQLNSV